MKPSMSLAAGARLGAYRIRGLIGAGGMGEVYRARDEHLGRDVAIKILPPQVAHDAERLARFEREAKALAALSHPNILTIYAFGTDQDMRYVVTEFLDGETLRARLARERFPRAGAIEIAATLADALAAAHARGVVHRDLKPENVMLTTDGRMKVVDFGLARLMDAPAASHAPTTIAALATTAGAVMGTPGYMAPEQVRGEIADHRADIFALGCLTYELVTGRAAFLRGSTAETFSAILHDSPPDLSASGVPDAPELQRVVARCLQKHPDGRFQSASDLAFALRESVAPGARDTPRLGRARADDRPLVAVLPFANLSADPEQEYFCDGMAEEIINALVHIDGLRVVARTSSFAFKGRHEDVREIGARLDARLVVEGSVRRSGDRLRITAQLVDVGDGSHLWSERYDRRLSDVFAVQDEIALAVVDNLKIRLVPRERAALTQRSATNLSAYDAYLKGLFYWNRLSPEALAKSCECFEEAIRLDPDIAPAYVFLAQAHASGAFWTDIEPAPVAERAVALVDKALAINPECAEAHTARGVLTGYFSHDWPRAEDDFRTGLRLGPSLAFAHLQLAGLFFVLGRRDEASLEARMTLQLDPVSPTTSAWAAFWLAWGGSYEEGLQHLEEIAAKNPTYWMPCWGLSMLYAQAGLLDAALVQAEHAVELSGTASHPLAVLGAICYMRGDPTRGDEAHRLMQQRAAARYVSPTALAWMDLARGDIESGVTHVERAVAVNDPMFPFWRMSIAPLLPTDRRIEQALTRIGLPAWHA